MKLDIPDDVLQQAKAWAQSRPPDVQELIRAYPLFTKVHVDGLGVRLVTSYMEADECGHQALGLGLRPEERSEYVCVSCAEDRLTIIEHAEPYTPALMAEWISLA